MKLRSILLAAFFCLSTQATFAFPPDITPPSGPPPAPKQSEHEESNMFRSPSAEFSGEQAYREEFRPSRLREENARSNNLDYRERASQNRHTESPDHRLFGRSGGI